MALTPWVRYFVILLIHSAKITGQTAKVLPFFHPVGYIITRGNESLEERWLGDV